MLEIKFASSEIYDEVNNVFYSVPERVYRFEHSLKAISLWEEQYRTPFLSRLSSNQFTTEEFVDYIRYMSLDGIDPSLINKEVVELCYAYMSTSHTATVIKSDEEDQKKAQVLTAEVIYAYMAIAKIPFECDSWNINKLMLVLAVVAETKKPPKEMDKKDVYKQYDEINERRLAAQNKQLRGN